MLETITVGKAVFAIGLCVFTGIALYTDVRFKKITNKLNVTALAIGVLVRTIFYEDFGGEAFYDGLLSSFGGFAIGFGVLFVLFIIGGGGGGDVKFMAAIGGWVGPRWAIAILGLGAFLVVTLSIVFALWSMFTKGFKGTRDQYLQDKSDPENDRKKKKKNRTVKASVVGKVNQRGMMTYALPIALATWILVAIDLFARLPSFMQS